jgi:hypothetical protein
MSGLGRELTRSLAERNVVPRLVADRPQEWRLGRLTVVVAGQRARLRYARQPVGATGARASEIAAAWQRALARLEARSLPPDALLPKLAAAYRALATGSGERVSLVAVRDELGYGRAQFAWDVARLRYERRLIVDGNRVDLGIATGTATSRRSRVVWIEDDGGSGAFYETLRLMEVRT